LFSPSFPVCGPTKTNRDVGHDGPLAGNRVSQMEQRVVDQRAKDKMKEA